MKLQQLRFVREVARNGLNISTAAQSLNTAQPGVSSQIRQLEDELGIDIFLRHGKRLTGITEPGYQVVAMIERVLQGADSIKSVAEEFSQQAKGRLSIATTHTQARYSLPAAIKRFTEQYPDVSLTIHQGNPTQICEYVLSGEADIAIATEAIATYDELATMPCYDWNRCVIAPPDHPLLAQKELTLANLSHYPIITYDYAFAGRSKINKAFSNEDLKPDIVLTAIDSDVIKTYVELGLGVGILASVAFSAERDTALRSIDAGHLFESSTVRIGIRRGSYLRSYIYDFIQYFAPHLTREVVDEAMSG
ncbi:MAG: HTH-type transcriptional regulator CysB [Gammaproteobacteria bacterium]|nr:HTH-type transcriptional regulator CysB [Gammaproteobacteria bacterium]PCH62585.1 MAG: HTH-type transcriptional regulator CysB [Gammaproteobacteria bacterium]PCH64524.1 MAG: HTH-type transcriptional regulator CysB [Gammaproteobacteria bacterium]